MQCVIGCRINKECCAKYGRDNFPPCASDTKDSLPTATNTSQSRAICALYNSICSEREIVSIHYCNRKTECMHKRAGI